MNMREKMLAAAETGAQEARKTASNSYRDESGRRTKVMGWNESLDFGSVSEPEIFYNSIVDAALDAMRDIPDTMLIYSSTDPISVGTVWRNTIDAIKAGK